MSRRKQAKPRLWKQSDEDVHNVEDDDPLISVPSVPLLETHDNLTSDSAVPADLGRRYSYLAKSRLDFTVVPRCTRNLDIAKLEIEDDVTSKNNLLVFAGSGCRSVNSEEDADESYFMDDENSLDSDTLGTDGGLSWVSEDQTTASPSSSCATPNSITEVLDSELSFTVGVTDGTPHACRFCDKAFPRHSYLKKHEQSHTDCMPFRCEYCRRLFKHKRSRDRHIKLHTGDKKYRCTQCDAAFSRSDHLKIHMKTHDNQKPFQCTVCNRGYNTAAALTSHMQNHKKSIDNAATSSSTIAGTTFRCLQCSDIFSKPEDLQAHMNSHPQSDTSSGSTVGKSHKNSSSSIAKYTSTFCAKENFTTVETLQLHVQSSHKSIFNQDLSSMVVTNATTSTTSVQSKSKTTNNNNNNNNNIKNNNHLSPLASSAAFGASATIQQPSSYFCELCTMEFATFHALYKHTHSVHSAYNNNNNNNNGYHRYALPSDLIHEGKLYCIYCATHFLTPASFAEHYILFHSPYHHHHQHLQQQQQLLPEFLSSNIAVPPLIVAPEQVKPTDLSIATNGNNNNNNNNYHHHNHNRKLTTTKRTITTVDGNEESRSPSRKKSSIDNVTSPGSSSGTATNSVSSSSVHSHYDYAGTLLCSQCNAAFGDFESFRAHIKQHIEESGSGLLGGSIASEHLKRSSAATELMCPHCRSIFSSVEEINRHVATHFLSTDTEFGCASCNKQYQKPDELQKHLMDIHAHHLYSCTICNEIFKSKVTIQVHFAVTHSVQTKNYKCTVCIASDATFHSEMEFMTHVKTVHASGNPLLTSVFQPARNVPSIVSPTLQCTICNSSFPTELDLQLHLATHGKQFQCTLCPQSFHIEYLLDKHMQQHHQNTNQLETSIYDDKHLIKKMYDSHSPITTTLNRGVNSPGCSSRNQNLVNNDIINDNHINNNNNNNNNIKNNNNSLNNNNNNSNKNYNGQLTEDDTNNHNTHTTTYCDICEKQEFVDEMELATHKKLVHNVKTQSSNQKITNTDVGKDNESSKNVKSNSKQQSQKFIQQSKIKSDTSRHAIEQTDIVAAGSNNAATISCDVCDKRDFVNEAELQSHKKLAHHAKVSSPGKLSLNCAYCNETCKSRNDLEVHMKTHSHISTGGKHKCIICDEMCPSAAILAEHKLTHCKVLSGKTCMHCKGSISTEEEFYYHIQQHNGIQTSNQNNVNNCSNSRTANDGMSKLILPTVCVICRQTLVSEMEAQIHARFHLHHSTDAVPCSVCFQTVDKQELIVGICRECYQRHGKSSPFRCPECHLNFETGTAIEVHLSTVHRKLYQCLKCQVSFDSEKEIQHHVATHLMIDGLNSHECRICRRVLPTPLQLQAHLIEHTFAGCSTFTCYLCSSVFTTAQGLQTHILEHGLSARPYDCPRCKQKFFFTSELEHHSYIHMEETLNLNGDDYRYKFRQENDGAKKDSTSRTSSSSTIPFANVMATTFQRTSSEESKNDQDRYANLPKFRHAKNFDFNQQLQQQLNTYSHNFGGRQLPISSSAIKELNNSSIFLNKQTNNQELESITDTTIKKDSDIKTEIKEEALESDDDEQIDVVTMARHEPKFDSNQ